jgi:dienelactone hydrolase
MIMQKHSVKTSLVKKFMVNIKHTFLKLARALTPDSRTVIWGSAGIMIAAALILIIPLSGMIKYIGYLPALIIISTLLTAIILIGLLSGLLLQLIHKIDPIARLALFFIVPPVIIGFGLNNVTIVFVLLWIILFSFITGAGISLLIRHKQKKVSQQKMVLVLAAVITGITGLAGGTVWLVHPGQDRDQPVNASLSGQYIPEEVRFPDPSTAGTYMFETLSYGSGEDKRRIQYGDEADLITEPVDGSVFLSSWEGFTGKLRSWYFGFDKSSLPLNARVWYPVGSGPFPLVIAVHGNHLAQDWSEGGYAYLGELLASRGYIFVSVDQNFLNGSFTDIFFKGLHTENDARGWLLLKHIEQWEIWNNDSLSSFYKMVDMDNIALAGHSRGGEAAAHAALFNRLPRYPDDAGELFDFNYNIRSLIAIAPSDRQYEPAGTGTPLSDINYLVLHGSHDADVQSFLGMRQYNRVSFTPQFRGFKSAIYIYRANHGQFNTSWGRKDGPSPRINLFNLKQLMPGEHQRQAAKVFISAFLDATLTGKDEYREIFMDYRTGRSWLPETIYLNQYEQADMFIISDFNEDLNPETTSLAGGRVETDNLTIWREGKAEIKWGDQETNSAVIGWVSSECDSILPGYSLILPGAGINGSGMSLFLTVAASGENPEGRSHNPETENGLPNENPGNEPEKTDGRPEKAINEDTADLGKAVENEDEDAAEPINFTIELIDNRGQSISFPLERFSLLQPPLETEMTKLAFMKTAPATETVFSFFCFQIDRFSGINRSFNPGNIKKIRLIFDKTEQGVVILNNIGLMPYSQDQPINAQS